MKVKPSVKKICDKCKVIRRHGRVMVICENLATSSVRASHRASPTFDDGSSTTQLNTTWAAPDPSAIHRKSIKRSNRTAAGRHLRTKAGDRLSATTTGPVQPADLR